MTGCVLTSFNSKSSLEKEKATPGSCAHDAFKVSRRFKNKVWLVLCHMLMIYITCKMLRGSSVQRTKVVFLQCLRVCGCACACRGEECPAPGPTAVPQWSICAPLTPLSGGLRVWEVEEANLADTDQAHPLPTGAPSFWPLTSDPLTPPSSSFCECSLNNKRCPCQTAPFQNTAANKEPLNII